jgi:hypothetical protein
MCCGSNIIDQFVSGVCIELFSELVDNFIVHLIIVYSNADFDNWVYLCVGEEDWWVGIWQYFGNVLLY